MPDIKSGLTVEGRPVNDNSGDAFEDFVAQQAGKEPAAKTPAAPVDPGSDTAEQIAAGLLETPASNQIPDGLTVETPPKPEAPAPEPVELSESDQAIYDRAGRELKAERLELQAGREALSTLAEFDYTARIEDAATEDELVEAVADYRSRVSEDVASEALWDLAAALSAADPESEEDDDLDEIGAVYELLDGRVRQFEAEQRAAESGEMAEKLLPLAAEQRVKDLGDTYTSWLRDKGFTEAEGEQRLNAVRETLAEEGIDLSQLIQRPDFDPGQNFYDLLNTAEAADHGARKAEAIRAFQEEVLGATSTNVGEGLTQQTPWGPMRLQDLRIPDVPQGQVNKLAQRRAAARQVTAESIRKSVAEPDGTSVASGFTGPDGKPLHVDDATGARERFRRQLEDDAARTRGLLR